MNFSRLVCTISLGFVVNPFRNKTSRRLTQNWNSCWLLLNPKPRVQFFSWILDVFHGLNIPFEIKRAFVSFYLRAGVNRRLQRTPSTVSRGCNLSWCLKLDLLVLTLHTNHLLPLFYTEEERFCFSVVCIFSATDTDTKTWEATWLEYWFLFI